MLFRRLLMVPSALKKKKKIPKFVPSDTGLYVYRPVPVDVTVNNKVTSPADLTDCAIAQIRFSASAKILQILSVKRTGLNRNIWGVPWQDNYGQVQIFGRDNVYLSPPGSSYPQAVGPVLPATIVETPATFHTITGEYVMAPQRASASYLTALTNYQGKTYPVFQYWPYVGSGDNLRFGDIYASGPYDLDPIVGNPQGIAQDVVFGQGGPEIVATGELPNGAWPIYGSNPSVTYGSGSTVTIDGTAYPAASVPATNWYRMDSGVATYSGTQTNGANTANWQYTTSYNTVMVYAWNGSAVTVYREDQLQGTYSWANGTTAGKVDYSLSLPSPPTIVADDAVTANLYDVVSGGMTAIPASRLLTPLYGEFKFLFKGYATFPPITKMPQAPDGSAPATNMPYFSGSGLSASNDFTLPSGTIGTKAAVATPQTFTAVAGAFSAYTSGIVTQGTVNNFQYVAGYRPGLTDTFGQSQLTAYRSSHTSTTAATTGSFHVDDAQSGAGYTITVLWAAYWNLGSRVLFYPHSLDAASVAAYPTLMSAPLSSVQRDGLVASGAAGSIIYTVDPTLTYTAKQVPFLWEVANPPTSIGITGLAVDGNDAMFEVPFSAATTVGRRANITAGTLNYIGQRGSVAYFFANISTSSADLVDIGTIVAGATAATKTFKGQTVRRMGVNRIERLFDCIIAIDTTATSGADIVTSVAAIRGSRSNPGTDIGQLLDANGNPTGQYVDWANPGQAYARTFYRTGTRVNFGATLTCTGVLLASDGTQDWMLDAKAQYRVPIQKLFANQAQAGSVEQCAATPSGYATSTIAYALPHAGAIVRFLTPTSTTTSYGHVSTDGCTTWIPVQVIGDVTIFKSGNGAGASVNGVVGNGGAGVSPGSPLFAY